MSYLATSKVRNELYHIATQGFREHPTENSSMLKDALHSEPFVIADKDIYINPPAVSEYQIGYELCRGSLLVKLDRSNVPKEVLDKHKGLNTKEGSFLKILVGYKELYHVIGPATYNSYSSDYFFLPQEQLKKLEVEVVYLKDIICKGESLYDGIGMEVEARYVDGVDVLLCTVVQKQEMRNDIVRYHYKKVKGKLRISVQVLEEVKWKTIATHNVEEECSFSSDDIMKVMDDIQLANLEGADKEVFSDEQKYKLYMHAPDKLFHLGVTSPRTLDYYLQHGVPIETLDQIRFLLAVEQLDQTTFLESLMSGSRKSMSTIKTQNKVEEVDEKLSARTRVKLSSIFK